MARRKKPGVPPPPWVSWVHRLDAVFLPDGKLIEPLSERWRQARRGRLTASERAAIIHDRRPAEWNALMDALDAELADDYQWVEKSAPALSWGRDNEKAALASIELAYGREVVEPGLIFHPELPFVAATPDGLIEDDKRVSIQVKCPYNPKNHLDTLYTKTLRPVYYMQVQWEAWVTKADEIEFYSFDPRQPLATRLVRLDIPVNREVLDRFSENVRDFATMYSQGRRLAEGKLSPMGVLDNLF